MRNTSMALRNVIGGTLTLCAVGFLAGCADNALALQAASGSESAVAVSTDGVVVAQADAAETSKSLEIRCQLSARDGRNATIQWVIKDGTEVKKGDKLVRFDSGGIEQEVSTLTTQSHFAKADLMKARAEVASAEIALAEFQEGLSPLEEQRIKIDIFEAKMHLDEAGGNTGRAEMAKLHLAYAEMKLDVHRRFTVPRRLEELKGAIVAAQADLEARTEHLRLVSNQRDRLLEQLESCLVRAPQDGRVTRADANGIRPGAIVRQGQVLLYLREQE